LSFSGYSAINLVMIIDFHTHVFPAHIKKNRSKYIDSDPCFAVLYSNPKAKLVTADELIAGMDEAGVDISVIANYGWTLMSCVLRPMTIYWSQ